MKGKKELEFNYLNIFLLVMLFIVAFGVYNNFKLLDMQKTQNNIIKLQIQSTIDYQAKNNQIMMNSIDNIDEMDAHHHSYEKCLEDIDEDKKEDIFYKYFNDRTKWCNIEIGDEYIAYEPCDIEMSLWGENESIGFQIKPHNSVSLINTGIVLQLKGE